MSTWHCSVKYKWNIVSAAKEQKAVDVYGWCHVPLESPKRKLRESCSNINFSFHFIDREKKKQGVYPENSTKPIFIYRHQKKKIISQNCVSHHLKASYLSIKIKQVDYTCLTCIWQTDAWDWACRTRAQLSVCSAGGDYVWWAELGTPHLTG